jgi:hypothetical protein
MESRDFTSTYEYCYGNLAVGSVEHIFTRSKDIRSFQFQISSFIIIWLLGQVAGILQDGGIIALSPLQGDIGLEIHVILLVFFSIMSWVRFYYLERKKDN